MDAVSATLSPTLSPRDLARLRDPESGDSVGAFALEGGESGPDGNLPAEADGASPAHAAHAPLPAEAHAQAQLQTREMHRLFGQGQHNEAFHAGRHALAHWHALQEHAMSCEVLQLLSAACMEHEQGVEALALARHALRLARVRVLPVALVQSLSLLGVLHGRLHDVGVGETLVMQALSRARELNNRPVLMQTLNALLCVLLEAHEVQHLAGDSATMQATAQRLQRHANHALAQSGSLPDNFTDLQLRTQAAGALVACGRAGDALQVLTECTELARQAGYRGLGLWAQLYGAQASMLMGNDTAALAAVQALAPLLSADEPPRLRLAHLSLQALLAEREGAHESADGYRAAAHALRDALLRQRFKLRATLRRNADDVMQTLSTLDREWQERGVPPRSTFLTSTQAQQRAAEAAAQVLAANTGAAPGAAPTSPPSRAETTKGPGEEPA